MPTPLDSPPLVQLIERASRDFIPLTECRHLEGHVNDILNNHPVVADRLAIERLHLQPLAVARFPDYEPLLICVRNTSTIEVRSFTHRAPSRLIG